MEQIEKYESKKDIISLLEAQKPAFKRVLNTIEAADRFVRIAITVLKNNPKLLACDPLSLLGSLMTCAQLGLEPNTPLQEAALIPYEIYNKSLNKKVMTCNFQIMYRGLEKLVWNSGMIVNLDYDKICTNDKFIYEKGDNPIFIHIPNLTEERGIPYAYYAYADIKGGGRAKVVMSKNEIREHAVKYSKMYNKELGNFTDRYGKPSVWETNFDEMAIKTVLIQLCSKKLPKSTTKEMLQIISASNLDNREIKILPENLNQLETGFDISEQEYLNENEEEAINELTPDILKKEPEGEPALDFNSKLHNSMNNKKVK